MRKAAVLLLLHLAVLSLALPSSFPKPFVGAPPPPGTCTTSSSMMKGHDMRGTVSVLTGGDTGIALPTSTSLAAAGGTVILASYSQAHGNATAKNITRETGNPNVYAIQIDLGSLDSVRTFAKQLLAKHKVVDLLVNDAGIDGENPQRMTKDGYEECIQVNYIGHALLTELLMPALRASKSSRVINMASLMASMNPCLQAGKPDDCLAGEEQWNRTVTTFAKHPTGMKAWMMSHAWEKTANLSASNYAVTKFMLVAHAKAVAEREAARGSSVHAFAMRPGLVNTHLLAHFSWVNCEAGCVMSGFKGCIKGVCPMSPEQAAATLTWLVVTNTSDLTPGGYYYRCQAFPLPGTAKIPDTGVTGWNWTSSPAQLLAASAKWVAQKD